MGDEKEETVDLREEAPVAAVEEVGVGTRAAEAVLRSAVRPEETVVAYGEGLVRIVLQLFESCGILLTDQRLLVAQRAWVNHWEVKTELELGSCEVVEDRVRFDASRLLVVRSEDANLCLYFGHRWRKPAAIIAEGLSSEGLASREESNPYDAREEAMTLLHDMSAAALVGP